MTFSERVKLVKKNRGITNEELSKSSGVPLGTLGKLLSGHIEEPKISTALDISKALGCSLEYLATGKEDIFLTDGERDIVEKLRSLDSHGQKIFDYILNEEYARCREASGNNILSISENTFRKSAAKQKRSSTVKTRRIPLYDNRVSAGTGMYLDSGNSTEIAIVNSPKSRNADFAVKVSGNSMEPHFKDGDTLLVRSAAEIPVGTLGIFICDGEGYFKKLGDGELISLNKDYSPIPMDSFTSFMCKGEVIGVLKPKE